jgi:hypothetical protein
LKHSAARDEECGGVAGEEVGCSLVSLSQGERSAETEIIIRKGNDCNAE